MLGFLIATLAVASHKPALTDLSPGGVELKRAFERADGDVRMLLLLSPG
jgi:hypothetical protein